MISALAPILPIVLCLCCAPKAKAVDGEPVAKLKRFDAVPGSKIMLEGEVNMIRNWKVEGALIGGFLEVAPGFPGGEESTKKGGVPARAEVFIPVRNLKGVGESWEPYNEQRTSMVHKKLRAEEHPKILFRLRELVRAADRRSPGVLYEYESAGDLIIAGVTNRVSVPVRVESLPGAKLRISGTAKIKQSDFNIILKPKIVFEYMDRDTVNVAFEWIVGQKGGT